MADNPILNIDFSNMFTSGVVDMKNSLNMLMNTMESLIDEASEKDSEQVKKLAYMEYEAARINGELSKLLTIHQLLENEIRMHTDEHFVKDTIDEQIAQSSALFKTRDIDIQVECDENLVWYYDSELIGSVIHNVLISSARYSQKKLIISASLDNEMLRITVSDDGAGYPSMMIEACKQLCADFSFVGGTANLGILYAFQVLYLHEHSGHRGSIEMNNNGTLGGGEFHFIVP